MIDRLDEKDRLLPYHFSLSFHSPGPQTPTQIRGQIEGR